MNVNSQGREAVTAPRANAGIDVSKDWLDVAFGSRSERFANDAAGMESLAALPCQEGIDLVVLEASGGCEAGADVEELPASAGARACSRGRTRASGSVPTACSSSGSSA